MWIRILSRYIPFNAILLALLLFVLLPFDDEPVLPAPIAEFASAQKPSLVCRQRC